MSLGNALSLPPAAPLVNDLGPLFYFPNEYGCWVVDIGPVERLASAARRLEIVAAVNAACEAAYRRDPLDIVMARLRRAILEHGAAERHEAAVNAQAVLGIPYYPLDDEGPGE